MEAKKIGRYVPYFVVGLILLYIVVCCSLSIFYESEVSRASSEVARNLRKIRKEYAAHEEKSLFMSSNCTNNPSLSNSTVEIDRGGLSLGDY